MTDLPPPKPLLRGTRGAIACGHPLAAEVGARIFAAGGTSVDAAVASGLALCVLLPDACGLGGDALALLRDGDGREVAFNGWGTSPAGLDGPIPADGGATVDVPGAVAALADLHVRGGGRLSWDRVLQPAIELAELGMPLSDDLAWVLARHSDRLNRRCAGWSLLAPGLTPGSLVRQPELAATLRRIANEGPDGLYRGPVAAAIAQAAHGDGGWLDEADLEQHVTPTLEPVVRTRLGARISVQPPLSQASLLLTALGALESRGPLHGSERTHVLAEALAGAFEHRAALADPAQSAAVADAAVVIEATRVVRPLGPEMGAHTTALAVADADGRVVSMLLSVFQEFGSALLVPEGGFLLNDRAHGFTTDANAAAPSKRPVHTLSPAMVADESRSFALCTPGADGQVQTLAQLLVAIELDRLSIPDAMAQPRFRTGSGRLALEQQSDPELVRDLARRGHVTEVLPSGGLFGVAACAGIDLVQGTVFAAADPRRESWAIAL